MLKPEIKAKIVSRLRNAKQCVGRMRRGDMFCAFGVILDVFHEMTGLGRWDGEKFEGEVVFDPITKTHVNQLTMWLKENGLDMDWLHIKPSKERPDLTGIVEANDIEEMTLSKIADFIDAQW